MRHIHKKWKVWMKPFQETSKVFFPEWPRFLCYQVYINVLFYLILFPLFLFAAQNVLTGMGFRVVTDSLLPAIVKRPRGMMLVVVGVILLSTWLVVANIGMLLISSRVVRGREAVRTRSILAGAVTKIPRLLFPGMLVNLIYFALFIPLERVGVQISGLQGLHIPDFIMDAVFSDPKNLIFGGIILLVCLYLSFRWMFFFPLMLDQKKSIRAALRESAQLFRNNRRMLLSERICLFTGFLGVLLGLAAFWRILIQIIFPLFNLEKTLQRTLVGALFLVQGIGGMLIYSIFSPFAALHLYRLFVRVVDQAGSGEASYYFQPKKERANRAYHLVKGHPLGAWGIAIVFLVLSSIGVGTAFRTTEGIVKRIEVVGHRCGGGKVMPENSISGIKYSIEHGASWIELDVQRTRDGEYILNHDATFQRVAGVSKSSREMTYAQIRKLSIGTKYGDPFRHERIPTLREALRLCCGRIAVNIELKGETADRQMAEDVIAIVQEEGMLDQVILSSLDHELIAWVYKKYPQVSCGSIYFLYYGDVNDVAADWLILEETSAREDLIDEAHQAGKGVMVWTINDDDSMKKFMYSGVDAIITDEVSMMGKLLNERWHLSKNDLLFKFFFQ